MIISNITPPQVWTASSRSLTNIGSGALAPTSVTNTSIAGAAAVDLRPSVGIVAQNSIAVITGAGATAAIFIQLSDGSATFSLTQTAAAAAAGAAFSAVATNSVWTRLLNGDATHAGNYIMSSYSFTI